MNKCTQLILCAIFDRDFRRLITTTHKNVLNRHAVGYRHHAVENFMPLKGWAPRSNHCIRKERKKKVINIRPIPTRGSL